MASHQVANAAQKAYHAEHPSTDDINDVPDDSTPVLVGVTLPDPVFFCAIEPVSMSQQRALDDALDCLTKEDPSLRVTHNADTGQVVLAGMGELHLEVIQDRLLKVGQSTHGQMCSYCSYDMNTSFSDGKMCNYSPCEYIIQ